VEAKIVRSEGRTRIEITARDADGKPLGGLEAAAHLSHPTDRRADRILTLREDTSGHFRAAADAGAGQWDLVIELLRGGERQFRSRNRIVLK
jgi:nitrogen fixation protein FixH